MDVGTRLDQVAAVSRLLSGAYDSDDVLIRTTGHEDYSSKKSRAYTTSCVCVRNGQALPLSEISASVIVERAAVGAPRQPTWAERVDALHTAAMAKLSQVATKAAEIAAAGKATP